MESKLRNIKRAMKQSVMQNVQFDDQLKSRIRQQALQSSNQGEHVRLAILQLLQNELSGFELGKMLRARGITAFVNLQGDLYVQLHELEAKELIMSQWNETETGKTKVYIISTKGKRLLENIDMKAASKLISLHPSPKGGM